MLDLDFYILVFGLWSFLCPYVGKDERTLWVETLIELCCSDDDASSAKNIMMLRKTLNWEPWLLNVDAIRTDENSRLFGLQ